MSEINKTSNFIGQFFRKYLKQTGFDRKVLIKKLRFDYVDNAKALCDYMNKKDYLWWAYEVKDWCNALGIPKTVPIYAKLVSKAGKKVK